ncbi:hypothetical protein [Photobacterium kishitanii]|uniref:Uncharacterized protein n=1 Tax=Photobacterium kishitanii TaxID=318456 RepID=A0A2T3KMQ6_9GAMM|nr:hypothetical protein [Photobacterium kishitanii]PSV01071.1 hypothetical protein C9J27_03370 [Photobacterium kishitanii]
MTKFKIALLVALSLISTSSFAKEEFKISDFHDYENHPEKFLKDFDVNEKIDFKGSRDVYEGNEFSFPLVKTKGLVAAEAVINAQKQFTPIRRTLFKKYIETLVFEMQNVKNEEILKIISSHAAHVSYCAFYGFDKERAFLVEKSINRLLSSNKERSLMLYAANHVYKKYVTYPQNKGESEEWLMTCGSLTR